MTSKMITQSRKVAKGAQSKHEKSWTKFTLSTAYELYEQRGLWGWREINFHQTFYRTPCI